MRSPAAATRTTRRSSPRRSRSVRRSRFASCPKTNSGLDIHFNESAPDRGITVEPVSEVYVSRGAKGLAAVKTGYATIASRDASGALVDYVVLRVAKPDALVVYSADDTRRARRLTSTAVSLSAGDRKTYRAFAQENKAVLAGSLQIEWTSSNPPSPTSRAPRTARRPSSRNPPGPRRSSPTGGTFTQTSRSRCSRERAGLSRLRAPRGSAARVLLAGCGADYDHTDIAVGHAPPSPLAGRVSYARIQVSVGAIVTAHIVSYDDDHKEMAADLRSKDPNIVEVTGVVSHGDYAFLGLRPADRGGGACGRAPRAHPHRGRHRAAAATLKPELV